jgi:transcriptional regulator with XRE-family HTH domain
LAVDIRWFQNRIRDLGLSQRRISSVIANNPNTLSLILNGKRRVSHEEIPVLARELDATPEEILKRLGVEQPASKRQGNVKVLGVVDETGRVTERSATRSVEAPGAKNANPANLRAVIYEAAGTKHPHVHGWTLFFEQPAKPRGVDADSLDALCIVEIGDKDGYYVGVVKRGLERGRYDLVNGFSGDLLVGGVNVRSAAPVAWIKAAA